MSEGFELKKDNISEGHGCDMIKEYRKKVLHSKRKVCYFVRQQ